MISLTVGSLSVAFAALACLTGSWLVSLQQELAQLRHEVERESLRLQLLGRITTEHLRDHA